MKTCIEFDTVTRDYSIHVEGHLQGYRPTITAALELLGECVARYERQGSVLALSEPRAAHSTTQPLAA
jgi:hypothetical protein